MFDWILVITFTRTSDPGTIEIIMVTSIWQFSKFLDISGKNARKTGPRYLLEISVFVGEMEVVLQRRSSSGNERGRRFDISGQNGLQKLVFVTGHIPIKKSSNIAQSLVS